MSRPQPELTIRRILVPLDLSSRSLAALGAAVELAASTKAELLGLFVEEPALLGLADIPCVREIHYFSAASAPVTRTSIHAKLRAEAARAQEALRTAAQRLQVPWSFRTTRGEMVAEILSATAEADLITLFRGRGLPGGTVRVLSVALELAARDVSVLLLPEEGLPGGGHLVVYYDRSEDSRRALQAAVELAESGMDGITVLLAPEAQGDARSLEEQVGGRAELRYVRAGDGTLASLIRALKTEERGIFVLGGSAMLETIPALDDALRESGMPLLVLGKR